MTKITSLWIHGLEHFICKYFIIAAEDSLYRNSKSIVGATDTVQENCFQVSNILSIFLFSGLKQIDIWWVNISEQQMKDLIKIWKLYSILELEDISERIFKSAT